MLFIQSYEIPVIFDGFAAVVLSVVLGIVLGIVLGVVLGVVLGPALRVSKRIPLERTSMHHTMKEQITADYENEIIAIANI